MSSSRAPSRSEWRSSRVLPWALLLVALWPLDAGASACRAPVATAASAPGLASTALAQGNALQRSGEASAALDAYLEAERIARSSDDDRIANLASANAARATLDAGRIDGVAARLDAVTAAARAAAPSLRTALLLHVARSFARWPVAEEGHLAARRRAAALLVEAEAAATEAGDARSSSYALGWRGELYEQSGRLEEARTLTRQALFQADQVDAGDALYRWYWQLGRIDLAAGDREAAITSYRKAVVALEAVRSALALRSEDAALAFGAEVEPVYLGLVDLLLGAAAQAPGSPAEQALLGEARDTLEAGKAAELRDYFRDECLAAQRQTTPDVVPGAVVLYPVLLADRVELIVGQGGRLARHPVPVDAATLVDEVHAFRRLLTKRTTRQYLPHAQRLYDWLITPITGALEAEGVNALVVVSTGALRTVPFAALHDRATGSFLIEKLPIAVAPGLTLVEPRAIERESIESLIAGISEGIHDFAPLANVPAELDGVEANFPGTRLQNASFDVARFEQALTDHPMGIVHIASHGEFRADASKSFILAWDGPVTMDQVGDTVARARFRTDQPLELLTLSACQTAAGDDRAALGLAGVALRAGARSAVATLWPVNDAATAILIGEFYTQLRRAGVSRAGALQASQRQLIEDPRYRHPAYWSPFVVIGSWL